MIVPIARKARKNATASHRVPDMRSPSDPYEDRSPRTRMDLPPGVGANLLGAAHDG